MPTTSQDKAFAEEMKDQIDEIKMSSTALDAAISWIGDNLNPDDVFSEKQLQSWAENNGYAEKE
jgi:hypothetical protein